MEKMIKNIEPSKILKMASQVEYREGQVVSRTLTQNSRHSLTLFAFEKGEEISAHSSKGDALVYVLAGIGKITIADKEYILHEGDAILMPANVPHAVYAEERFKMMLTVAFPENPSNVHIK
jgi:quercetin dioxygenase-like cupin family protein